MGERQRWGAFALNTQGHPSVAPPPIARYPSTSSQPVESGRPGANIQLVLSPGTRGDQTGATLGSGPGKGLPAGPPGQASSTALSSAVWVVLPGPGYHQHLWAGPPQCLVQNQRRRGTL